MQRAPQLQDLSREHHASFVMAKHATEAAESSNEAALESMIEKIQSYYDDELEVHFQHEERTVFAPLFKEYNQAENGELIQLATRLLKEHGLLRMMIPAMTLQTAKQDLAKFAEILKTHTQLEERELFPAIEKLFDPGQLAAIESFVPLDW